MITEIEILFEDEDILVIEKPPGVVANRADTLTEPTLQDWMAERLSAQNTSHEAEWQSLVPVDYNSEFGTPDDIFKTRQGLVHRLDKDTSGVMIWAKNPGALVSLLAQFKNRQTTKKYVALVHGKFDVPEATLDMPIGRASQDRKLFSVKIDGRPAITRYKVIESFKELDLDAFRLNFPETSNQVIRRFSIYQGFSLVECWPKTGRTHQIRVHLAHIQHPLVGDTTYTGKKRKVLDPLWCPRQFLHAASLTFSHPRTGEAMEIQAPLSADLQSVLKLLH